MVLDAVLFNTKHYKVRIKGKEEQSKERSNTPPLHLGVVAIEKGPFGSPSTMVANFTYLESFVFDHNTWNCLTMWKWMNLAPLKMLPTHYLVTNHMYLIYV